MKYVDIPNVDSDQVSLELFPCSQNPSAVVIWIHGGGWVSGDRRNVRRMPSFFNSNNFLLISVNYPLATVGDMSLIDLQIQAFQGLNQWLMETSFKDTYSRAFDNINILAHSSGSHLVALADKRFGWNSSVRNLILMDSAAYDLKERFSRMRPFQKNMFSSLMKLDLFPSSHHSEILRTYSPALLPAKARQINSLNIVIVSSKRPGARYSAERLKNSYCVSGYDCRIYFLDWDHDYFPDAVGVDSVLNELILDTISVVEE